MTENDGRSCKGVKKDGSPCGAPGRLVDPETGFCDAHDPDKRDELRERGRRGGYVSTSPRSGPGMDLPPLDNLNAARVWAEETARALAEDRIAASKANAVNRILKTWMSAYSEGASLEAERAARTAAQRGVFGPRGPADDSEGE